MERQGELPAAYPRLFKEESWRDLVPEAVHGPLRRAAEDFFQSAVSASGDKSDRFSQIIADAFSQQLNSDCLDSLGENAPGLSRAETNYGVLLMRLASAPSGPGRDGLLRDLTLAREKLVSKERRAPATVAARSLAEKIGWRGAAEKLRPGSSGERLQAIEQAVLQKLGHQDLRSLFESQEESPQQVLERFMGKRIDEMVDQEEGGLAESGEESTTPEAELSKNIFGKISRWLKRVDWKFVGRGSASMLAGIGLSELFPTVSWVGGVLLGVNMLSRRVKGAEKVEGFIKSREAKYPKARERMVSRVAMGTAMGELKAMQAALKVVESPEAMFIGYGFFADVAARLAVASVGVIRQLVGAQGAGAGTEVPGGGGYQTGPSPDVRELQEQAATVAPGGEVNLRGPDAVIAGGQPPGEQPPVLSDEAGEFVNRVGEVAEQEAREMADAAQGAADLAERLKALQQGQTVAELAKGQTVSEAIYDMIGDIPHRGEVTNTLFRSLGDKVNALHEGAIRVAADALGKVFDSAHAAANQYGVPYEAGGRAAVEALKGLNSPEANALRAANMADMEAAAHVMEKVITPAIAPVLIQ